MLRTVLLAGLFSLLLAAQAAETSGQEVKPAEIRVQGVLKVGEFFGPPNYGEEPGSDRIEKSYYLQIPAPIGFQQPKYTVPDEFREAFERTGYFVQLVVFTPEQNVARRLVDSRVEVFGVLFQAETGHHRRRRSFK